MNRHSLPLLLCVLAAMICIHCSSLFADEAKTKSLLPPGEKSDVAAVSASGPDASFSFGGANTSQPALQVKCKPGKDGYPGVAVAPVGSKFFDLSAFGHIEARISNTGAEPISLTVRVDDDGQWNENPFSAESLRLKPGQTETVRVRFNYAWGNKAHTLKTAKITRVLIFVSKGKTEQSYRIESVQAGGFPGEKPADDPKLSRAKPKGGLLLGAGAAPVDAAKQIEAHAAEATLDGAPGSQSLRINFPADAKGELSVRLRPEIGRWDLADYLEVRVKVVNEGKTPVSPRIRLDSNGSSNGPSQVVGLDAPLAPGAEAEIVLPFSRGVWKFTPDTTTKYGSATTTGVVILADKADVARSIRVTSIRATLPPVPTMPEWLGKRPPVEGDWKQTFSDEFDGSAIDATKWNVKHPNYWDKPTHFSAENVIVGGGVAKLRYEKKRGRQDDDPKGKETDYAAGYLDTMNKFRQCYGYFEARMKLPTAPGLWPAFWMMPDRGEGAKNRQGTNEGAMEFDIMEGQSRWVPNRYNIAMHWNGYGKDHKAVGSDNFYVQPDKEGYITSGLLWTPGAAVFYCNGREIARYESERVSNVAGLMMFTLPQGGWDNDEVDDAKLPDDFVIDYVRVWQRGDLANGP